MTEVFPEWDTSARYEPDLVEDAFHVGHPNSLIAFKNAVRELKGNLLSIPASPRSSDRCLARDCLLIHFLAIKAHQVSGEDHYCSIKAADISK